MHSYKGNHRVKEAARGLLDEAQVPLITQPCVSFGCPGYQSVLFILLCYIELSLKCTRPLGQIALCYHKLHLQRGTKVGSVMRDWVRHERDRLS